MNRLNHSYSGDFFDKKRAFRVVFAILLPLLFLGQGSKLFGQPQTTQEISQFGITWTFDQPVEFGQFANGDYWVVGPVTIVDIFPPSTEINGRVSNGSMINPSPKNGSTQGYDSSMYRNYGPSFDPALNVARPNNQSLSSSNPLVVPTSSSLVSSISLADEGARPQLETAAILTVLDEAAPDGSFRPAYSGTDKSIRFHKDQIDWSLLKNLPHVESTPQMSVVERYFERPWIDHVPGWLGDYHHPTGNLPNYGRDISARVGIGAVMLHLDFPQAEKEKLLYRYLQVGIDLYGVVNDGGQDNWVPNGGHASGRKWPIVFAGLMFADTNMQNIGPGDGTGAAYFGEDAQTFFVTQSDIDASHNPDTRGCEPTEYDQSDLGLPEWGIRHATSSSKDNKSWCAVYRTCCTANSWAGFVLAAHLMDAKQIWNHDALFDYQDRYMDRETPGEWTRCFDPFTEVMWDTYRDASIPSETKLNLVGISGDGTARLSWSPSVTGPATATWRIQTRTDLLPAPVLAADDLPINTRMYDVEGLQNGTRYTISLELMSDDMATASESISVTPRNFSDFLFLPFAGR